MNFDLRLLPAPLAPVALAVLLALAQTHAQAQAQTMAPAATPTPAPKAAKPAARAGSASSANAPVTLNFVNADIAEVARTIAVITGRQVVVDPRVRGSLTIHTDKPLSPPAAYDLFLAMLRLQGFAVVQTAGLYKVVPEADAKLQGNELSIASPSRATPANQIMTQVFNLNFENANALVPVLRPLISANNTLNVTPGGNSLVITDYSENLQRLARLIAALDMPNAGELEIIPLRHAIAADLAPMVLRLLDAGGSSGAAAAGTGAESGFKTTVLAESRGNAVIVRAANPARTALARALVARLDQPSSAGGANGNIHVVSLKNADATKLAVTLRAALAGGSVPATATSTASGASLGGSGASTAAAGSATGGQIQADTATNSLIISAPEPVYRQLRAVIDLLDGRRAQVFVESLIAEVNADKAAQFGVQWQGAFGGGSNRVGVLGTNFGSGGNNILNLAAQQGGTVLPGTGLNFGLLNRSGALSGLGLLARFLEESGDGNILSTPNLLTLDNEEAKIVIGQNVPFVTGQFTNTSGGNGAVNPFQTIERKDVGLTLRVKPQISENGSVKLQVFQEVSSVQASSINAPSGLITNKRSIESSVMVEDGSIVVLGGLLQEEYAGNQEQVPGLGSVPFFGNLFKSESRSRKKTNLMVFLRPVVVRDADASQALSLDRYELMRGVQLQGQPLPSKVMPIQDAPVLPESALPALRVSPRMAQPSAAAPAAATSPSKAP